MLAEKHVANHDDTIHQVRGQGDRPPDREHPEAPAQTQPETKKQAMHPLLF